MRKRILSLFLALALLCGLLPQMGLTAHAETHSGYCGAEGDGSNLQWSFDEDTGVLTITGSGGMADYRGYCPWEDYSDDITAVSLPDGLTSISNAAFSCCGTLASVTIPNSVTSIGDAAFSCCWALASVTIPDSVTSIGGAAFEFCTLLTSVKIGNGVTSISERAFYGCRSLTSVTIPDGVTSIGKLAFGYYMGWDGYADACVDDAKIEGFTIYGAAGSAAQTYAEENGFSFISLETTAQLTGTCGTEGDGSNLIWVLDTETGLFSITGSGAMEKYSGVLSIPWRDYKDIIKKVEIGYGVTCITEHAFSFCSNLTCVTLPKTVQWIGDSGFALCNNLTDISLPDSISYIGWRAFDCDNLSSVTIKNSFCDICDDEYTLGSACKTTIYGYADSSAEAYANKYGYSFVEIKKDYPAYSFLNHADGPFAGFNRDDGYYLSGDHYYAALFARNPVLFFLALLHKKEKWSGHCFGMSAVYVLFHSNELELSKYQSGAKKLSDLDYPKDNKAILSMLTYYQFIQFTDYFCNKNIDLHLLDSSQVLDNSEAVVDIIKQETTPVLITFSLGKNGHAVVATSIAADAENYVIDIWDPNTFEPDQLIIKKDYSSFHFKSGKYDNADKITSAFTASDLMPYSVFPILTPTGMNQLPNTRQSLKDDNSNNYSLLVNYQSFEIQCGESKAVIEDGKKTSGDLLITDGFYLNEDENNLQIVFTMEAFASQKTPLSINATKSERGLLTTMVTHNQDSADGYLVYLTSSCGGVLEVSGRNNVSTSFDNEIDNTITMVTNTGVANWTTVSFTGNNNGIQLQPNDNKLVVSGCDGSLDIMVADKDRELYFGNCTVSDAGISIYSVDNAEVIHDNNTEQTIIEGMLPCSVYFNSMGGSLIDPLLNVPANGMINEPTPPVRQGYQFSGWYTSLDYKESDLWSFSTPVTSTITLFAKWEVDNPFADVGSEDFFFNPVLWAVNNNVTSGRDATHFAPHETVKRSEAMLFFYAAKGRPKFTTTNSPFKDVKKKHWFYDAVLWAVENKITSGTDATHFSPNKTCIRSEILQFLYAAMDKPEYTIENPYSDVKKKHWYYDGAIWAYEMGLERGSNGKFKAKTPCTRAYVVTYLYRFITGKELVK